jgi:hypothetical protein
MPEETLNPYAPPAEQSVPETDPAQGWSVQGEYLLVRPGTILPPVSLEGEDEGGVLVPGVRRFQVINGGGKGVAVAFIPSLLGLGWFIYCKTSDLDSYAWFGVVAIVLLARLFTGRIGGTVQITVVGFFSAEAMRRKKRRRSWIGLMMGLGLVLLFGTCGALILGLPAYLSSGGRFSTLDELLAWVLPAAIGGVVLSLGAILWSGMLQGLKCTAFREGWIYLRGVPHSSLLKLAERSREALPALRMRKVSKAYQFRLPFRVLLWNLWGHPWLAFWLVIFKLTRSQRLVRLQYHWSERKTLPLSEADADLVKRWREESPGTVLEGWRAVAAERRDSPQGDLRIEFLTYASPDWRHFACLVVTRVSANTIFSEIHQTILQSWAEDGRFFYTSSPPMPFLLPDYFDAREVRGSAGAIAEGHMARTAGQALLSIEGRDHLYKLYEVQAEDIAALYESRGLQSPPEEMELRDMPV